MKLRDRVAVVTGANGGIGQAICKLFLQEGAIVVAADRSATARQADVSPKFQYRELDVTNKGSVCVLRDEVKRAWGRVDILVNNAGAMLGKPLSETTDEDFDGLMAVNVRGPLAMMREIVPLMPANGSVINMSSAAAVKPLANMAAYSASKSALSVLSRVAAAEFAPVRVNSVQPGTIDTPMPRSFVAAFDAEEQERQLDRLRQSRFLKRMGDAGEVAAMVLFLASDDASFVTGADFLIDGGRL